jgi:hypothetical protein
MPIVKYFINITILRLALKIWLSICLIVRVNKFNFRKLVIMKTVLQSLLTFIICSFLLTSCGKNVGVVADPIVGSWVLTDAAKGNANGWRPLYTGFENGVFTFYANGSASYDDGFIKYQGSWIISSSTTGYYDYYGNYYTDFHDALQVRLREFSTNSSINLYFEDVNFNSGNYFTATYYNNFSIERYGFSRY